MFVLAATRTDRWIPNSPLNTAGEGNCFHPLSRFVAEMFGGGWRGHALGWACSSVLSLGLPPSSCSQAKAGPAILSDSATPICKFLPGSIALTGERDSARDTCLQLRAAASVWCFVSQEFEAHLFQQQRTRSFPMQMPRRFSLGLTVCHASTNNPPVLSSVYPFDPCECATDCLLAHMIYV